MLFLATDEEARPVTLLYEGSHTGSRGQQYNSIDNVGTSRCTTASAEVTQRRTGSTQTHRTAMEHSAKRMGLEDSGKQADQHHTAMFAGQGVSQLPASNLVGVDGPIHSAYNQQHFIDGNNSNESNTTVASDRGTSHGNPTATQRGTCGTMRSSDVPACRCPTQTKEQRSSLVVDVHSMREQMATNRIYAATTSCPGSVDDRTSPQHTLRSSAEIVQGVGNQGNGGAWQWHAPAVAAFCDLGTGAGKPTPAGDSSCYLVGDSAKPADSRRRRGHGVYPCPTDSRGSIGAVRSRALLHELQHVVFPQQRRLQQRQFGGNSDVKGVLLGLYTRQGGTGVTKATLRYPHLVKLLTDLSRHMGWQQTSVQVNVLDSSLGPNTSVGLHLDKFNSPGTTSHLVVVGDFVGGKFWLEDQQTGGIKPPSYLCLGQEPPADLHGRWHEVSHGQWIEFLPTCWHGTDLVTKGVRFSCSFFTPGGLHRVSSATWALLQELRFNVKELALVSRTVLSLASWTSQRLQKDCREEPGTVLVQMEQEPPFSLRSGRWQMRDCLWLLLASCDTDQPYQQRWKQSALDLQRLGFVTIELSSEQAREQLITRERWVCR
eukprot:6490397-Amphidinium_carterae.2